MTSIACYGAANLDRTARCVGAPVLRGSNPVATRQAMGGVARNVDVNLAHLGNRVKLATAVGADAGGDELVRALQAEGIDASGFVRWAEAATASYTAVLDRDGELLIGLADMAIYDQVGPPFLERSLADEGRSARFIDANLPPDCIEMASRKTASTTLLAASTVSAPKAPRLLPVLDRLDVLFANRGEAAIVSGTDIQNPEDALRTAAAIRDQGTGMVFVTLGPEGAVAVSDKARLTHPAIPGTARNVVGAGDAFAAGALSALLEERPLHDAVVDGLAAASLTIEVDDPTDPALNPARVKGRAIAVGFAR